MKLVEHIRQYYIDEKSGALYAFIAAFTFLLIGIWLLMVVRENALSKGMATGFLISGVLVLLISTGSLFYNNQKIAITHTLRQSTEQALQTAELARMDKVMHVTFRYAFLTFAVLMATALSIIIFSRQDYWKGVGISLMVLVALVIISDSFSLQRNKAYQQKIINFKECETDGSN